MNFSAVLQGALQFYLHSHSCETVFSMFLFSILPVEVNPENTINAAHLALCLQTPAVLEARQKTKAVLVDGEPAVSRSFCDITKGCFPTCVCSVFPGAESTVKTSQHFTTNTGRSQAVTWQLGSNFGCPVPSKCRKNRELKKEAVKWPTPTRGKDHLTLCDITRCL